MRYYETLYIVNPDLTGETYKEVLEKFTDLIEKQKGVIVKVDEWGRQKLAYEVKKFDTGSYVLMNYCCEPGITAELERDLKLDDRVLKFQTVKLADKAEPQALIREQEEARTETVAGEEKAVEIKETIQNQDEESLQEVKDGDE